MKDAAETRQLRQQFYVRRRPSDDTTNTETATTLTTRRVSLPVPRVEYRVVPVKKSRDDDDVRRVTSRSDVRLTIDDDTERQLYSRLS